MPTVSAQPSAGAQGQREPYKLVFTPNPTQHAFIVDRAEASLFCGRMREGKTAGLVWSCFYHSRYNPRATWAIIRDTWDNLRRTTLQEFFRWFPPGVFGVWRAQEKTFYWRLEDMRGKVHFLGLDDPNDAGKLQSLDLAGFGIDEAAPAFESGGVSEDIFNIALTRLSQSSVEWRVAKLAQNNPDESHWTYARFVDPGTDKFAFHQPATPENEANIPSGYYGRLRRHLAGRPDLIERFVEGRFGFVRKGVAVTPEWRDDIHLARGLRPNVHLPLYICLDFGLSPTAVITQVAPGASQWLVLWCEVGENMGMEEYIVTTLRPALSASYRNRDLRFIGDPAGAIREQSSSARTAVRTVLRELGGAWRPGPKTEDERVQPLRAALARHNLIRVDRDCARAVWYALRGGWHRAVHKSGAVGGIVKDDHSHPGDCMGYGAAVLFPIAGRRRKGRFSVPAASYNSIPGQPPSLSADLVIGRPYARIPIEGRVIGNS